MQHACFYCTTKCLWDIIYIRIKKKNLFRYSLIILQLLGFCSVIIFFSVTVGLRRRGKNIAPHDSSALLNQLRHEEALRERESRKQQIQERRAAQEAMVQELLDWEEHLLEEPIKTQLKHMWEVQNFVI